MGLEWLVLAVADLYVAAVVFGASSAGAITLGLGAWLAACVRAEGADAPEACPPHPFFRTQPADQRGFA